MQEQQVERQVAEQEQETPELVRIFSAVARERRALVERAKAAVTAAQEALEEALARRRRGSMTFPRTFAAKLL